MIEGLKPNITSLHHKSNTTSHSQNPISSPHKIKELEMKAGRSSNT